MRSKILSYEQAGRNTQDGISLTQTAEGASKRRATC
jgi:flagellin-like hook-associated protein FlgL